MCRSVSTVIMQAEREYSDSRNVYDNVAFMATQETMKEK